jgi:hypothetical protein
LSVFQLTKKASEERFAISIFLKLIAIIALSSLSQVALADTVSTRNGDDTFFAGAQINQSINTVGDTFIAVRSAKVNGASQ